MPRLTTDLMAAFDEPLEIRLVDLSLEPVELCVEWGEAANRHWGRSDRFVATTDLRTALAGADAVLITISTGGLEAMAYDLAIPEQYGICATVGDTAGPGGWSRAIRNIPVFRGFAEDFAEICPTAFIGNYSNPMAALTATLQECCPNPVVGLCHSFFETKDVIQEIFGLPDWSQIGITIAGMNHFTWVIDFKIGREDGYGLLREKVGGGSLRDVLPSGSVDEIDIFSGHALCAELYDAFGYLPYPGDRHTSEFVSFVLSGEPERYKLDVGEVEPSDTTRYCDVRRTSIKQRAAWKKRDVSAMRQWINGEQEFPKPSRETGARMIHSYLNNRPLVDAINTLNVGQVPGLPAGACVETLGVIDGMGARPVAVGRVPEHLLEIMRPQAVCQKWITTGALEGDIDLLTQALYRDPQCACLKPHEVRQMASELLEANRQAGFIDF